MKYALALGIAATCAACGPTVSYTRTNLAGTPTTPKRPYEVEVFLSGPPSAPYTEVGLVEVRQELLSSAKTSVLIRELRAEAGRAGCDGVVVQSHDTVVGTGSTFQGTGSSIVETKRGFHGTCIVFRGGRKRTGLSTPAPLGALGYRFGDSASTVEAACREVDGEFTSAEGGATCSRLPATVTFAGTVEMQYCDRKLCVIEVVAPFLHPTDEVVLRRWNDATGLLERKYGHSTGRGVVEPPACKGRVVECIHTGQARYAMDWEWRDGHRIELRLDRVQPTVLRLRYVSSEKRQPGVEGL